MDEYFGGKEKHGRRELNYGDDLQGFSAQNYLRTKHSFAATCIFSPSSAEIYHNERVRQQYYDAGSRWNVHHNDSPHDRIVRPQFSGN